MGSELTATTPLEADIIVSAYRHRLLSIRQIHQLHTPGRTLRWTQRVLAGLERRGYLARARTPAPTRAGRHSLWWVTDIGADAAEAGEVPERRYRMTTQRALGPLQAHTLATNDVGLAFVTAARAHGHECSPADWDHEVAYRIADRPVAGPGSDLLVVDAVLNYTLRWPEGDELLTRFVEVDRGTETVARLAAKLRAYAALYEHVPRPPSGQPGSRLAGWHHHHLVFPRILVVLTGLTRDRLVRRRETLLELCRHDQRLLRLDGRLHVSVTTLDELTDRGPFAPIFWSPDSDQRRAHDVVGEAPPTPQVGGPAGQAPGQLQLVQP